MEQILSFITSYGLPVFIIASCCIVFLGILKLCKVFSKLTNKSIKKLIYYIIDIVLAFGGSAIYFAIYHKAFNIDFVMFSCTQVGATTTLYAIYENFGIRKLVQIGLTWIASWFKKNPNSKLAKALKGLGLNETSIQYLQTLTNLEVEKTKKSTVNNTPSEINTTV